MENRQIVLAYIDKYKAISLRIPCWPGTKKNLKRKHISISLSGSISRYFTLDLISLWIRNTNKKTKQNKVCAAVFLLTALKSDCVESRSHLVRLLQQSDSERTLWYHRRLRSRSSCPAATGQWRHWGRRCWACHCAACRDRVACCPGRIRRKPHRWRTCRQTKEG